MLMRKPLVPLVAIIILLSLSGLYGFATSLYSPCCRLQESTYNGDRYEERLEYTVAESRVSHMHHGNSENPDLEANSVELVAALEP